MGHPSTRQLLDSCARGPESEAWGALVHRCGPAIEAGVRRALRRTGHAEPDPAAVEDLVQEVYCRLLERGGRRLRSFRGSTDAEVRTWLRCLAQRTACDRLRSAEAAKRGRRVTVARGLRVGGSQIDATASPERHLLGRERLRALTRGWRRLAGGEREARIVRQVFFGGMTSREVSDASGGGLSPSSVDSVVFRFRKRLAREGLPVPLRG